MENLNFYLYGMVLIRQRYIYTYICTYIVSQKNSIDYQSSITNHSHHRNENQKFYNILYFPFLFLRIGNFVKISRVSGAAEITYDGVADSVQDT